MTLNNSILPDSLIMFKISLKIVLNGAISSSFKSEILTGKYLAFIWLTKLMYYSSNFPVLSMNLRYIPNKLSDNVCRDSEFTGSTPFLIRIIIY
jgi:hypothetical protein